MRKVQSSWESRPTVEGAGVRLRRAFGYQEVPRLDPFLLLDDFKSSNPEDYLAGFPWHPHRGIDTVTYVVSGEVDHKDSIGNSGRIRSGDAQWMTAGSGIIHQEMPQRTEGVMQGFQLWVNLPAGRKMSPPEYRDIRSAKIPEVKSGSALVKVIAGEVEGVKGPVEHLTVDAEFLDVSLPRKAEFVRKTKPGYKVFAYVMEGKPRFPGKQARPQELVLFQDGDKVRVSTDQDTARVLLVSGRPIGEPVAWYGPIVMNTQQELEQAFRDYQEGNFVRK